MLELQDVWKGYVKKGKQRWVLEGVNVALPTGRRIGLLGAEGAGKSSLLRLMGDIDRPDSGAVRRSGTICWPLGTASFLDMRATLRTNANFLGDVYNVDAEQVEAIALGLSGVRHMPTRQMKGYLPQDRRNIALGLTLALQFDWYFIDDRLPVVTGDQDAVDRAMADRFSRATVVWSSRTPDLLQDYCNAGLVLDRGALRYYDSFEDAVEAYGRVRNRKARSGT